MSEKAMPAQHQPRQPGDQSMMSPRPDSGERYRAAGKLEGRVGLITGGDSGIGRAVAVLFAKEGADVAFTRALSNSLVGQGVRVNGVAPGPIWTPLIPATFSEEQVEQFGKDTPMKRPGQPHEVATCYVFLASDDASYISGQFLHP